MDTLQAIANAMQIHHSPLDFLPFEGQRHPGRKGREHKPYSEPPSLAIDETRHLRGGRGVGGDKGP